MKKYVRKPIEVEAVKFDQSNWRAVEEWSGGLFKATGSSKNPAGNWICSGGDLHTPAGIVSTTFGDWIVKGINGVFSRHKDGEFHDNFDPLERKDGQD